MQIVPLPPPADLEKLLAGLLMRSVKVTKAQAPEPGAASDGPLAVALFRTDDPVLEVAVICDVTLAASMAAALSVIPASAVKECVAAGGLDDSLRENFAEVMNVVARFVSGAGRRFALKKVACAPEAAPELVQAANGSDERRDLTAEIAGYAGGRIAFCTL
jgi:hypothetical protein